MHKSELENSVPETKVSATQAGIPEFCLQDAHKKPDGWHMLAIPFPRKQRGRLLELSMQSSEFETSPGSTVRPCPKKKWIATED